jgi:hypothetical protein
MTGLRRLLLHAAVALAAAIAGGSQAQSPIRSTALKLHIESPKDRFIVKEQILVNIRIENTGAAPVSVPTITDNRNHALVYELTGPSVAAVHRFHYGLPGGGLPGEAEPVLLQPGQSTEARLDLGVHLPLWKTGPHSLQIRLGDTVSPPFPFTLEMPVVRSAQVVSNGIESAPRSIRLAFLDSHGQIYLGFFDEPDGLGEGRPESSFVPAVQVSADAHSVLVPSSNFDRSSLFFSRYGWRSDAAVGIDEAPSKKRVQLDLAGAHALRPALLQHSGDVDVFLMEPARLTLARLPRPGADPSRLWSVGLPGRAMSGSAVIGSPAAGGPLAAVVVSAEGRGLAITLVQNERTRIMRFEGLTVLPECKPAVAFGAGGVLRTSVLVGQPATAEHPSRIGVLDLTWPAGADVLPVESGPSSWVNLLPPQQALAGVVVYAAHGAPPRRDWVLLLDNGTLVSSRRPGVPTPLAPSHRPVRPLQLAPMERETYLLVHHPNNVLALQRLQ